MQEKEHNSQQQINSRQNIQLQQNDNKFLLFKKWFKQNGGLQKGINLGVRFQPGNYLGISAKEQIPPNTVILAVPKQLVVSVSRARQSQLKQIFKKYQIFANQQDDDSDYNILCLFLIMEKMKGQRSFYYHYIQLLDSSQTVMNWKNEEILDIGDPYINLKFIDSIRGTFQPIYQVFVEIVSSNRELFPGVFTRKMFDEMYAAVMTRGFGWGLPETMLVPYADFLNHSSTGVSHYVFDKCLQTINNSSSYIQKKHQLNLTIFPQINNQSLLPIDYERNIRERYINSNKQKLEQMNLQYSEQTRMDPTITCPLYNMLISKVIQDNFDDEVCLSTDSEDNDSDSEAEGLEESQEIDATRGKQPVNTKLGTVLMTRKYLRFAFKQVDKDLDQKFTQPKPNVNAQFEDGVKFQWWFQNHQQLRKSIESGNKQINQTEQSEINQNPLQKQQEEEKQDKYFIVSSSKKIYPNQQIYNCYGRRSNRFLLIWYGFCFQYNKYDSVPFRIWSSQISKKTGQTLYTRFLTQVQYKQGIPIGNQRYNAYMLSEEFRLKGRKIDYKLLAYLRYRFLITNRIYKDYYKARAFHVNRITSICMEIQCFLEYQKHLNTLVRIFQFELRPEMFENQRQIKEGSKFASARDYFRSILKKSNQEILIRNILAVNQVIKVLYEIETYLEKEEENGKDNNLQGQKQVKKQQKDHIKWQNLPKELLLKLYRESFEESQKQNPTYFKRLDIISGRQRDQTKKQLKIMVRQYFRIMSQSVVCRTLYTQFQ